MTEKSAPSPPSPAQRTLRVQDALRFLDEVKRRVSADQYSELLAVFAAFQAKTMDAAAVARHARALFQDHPALMEGFNVFLPAERRVHVGTQPDAKL